ncbi:MAG: hypothetical protein ACRDNW_10505 [Trebonia sp.]
MTYVEHQIGIKTAYNGHPCSWVEGNTASGPSGRPRADVSFGRTVSG